MRRREVIAAVAGMVLWPRLAAAQRSLLPVCGFLGVLSAAETAELLQTFQQGLSGMGFVDGTNLVVEQRWAESQPDRLPGLAMELVRRRAAVIVASGSGAAALTVKAAASGGNAIVFIESDLDPVKSGLVKSLSHPEGNITGVLMSSPDLLRKQLEELQDAAGDPDVIGMLVNPKSVDGDTQPSRALGFAAALGRTLKLVNATNEDEIDAAFSGPLVKPQVGALLVADDIFFLSQRDKIVAAAANNSLPAMYPNPAYVVGGGLMSYTADYGDAYKQAGEMTANILLGKKPADLPVRQMSKFQLVINRHTAGTLQIPDTVVNSAARIIEGNPNEASPIWLPGAGTPRPPG